LSISLSLAVSMITGTLDFSRSVLHTSLPGRPGSIRSSSTRSAPVRSKVSSASGPVEQTATSKPSLRSRYEIASLNESSSSTTSTRVTWSLPGALAVLSGIGAAHAAPVLACSLRSGMYRLKVDPAPSTLRTVTLPLWAAITCLTMASPRPVPPVARERAGSTR
jgi:hypothetical protein